MGIGNATASPWPSECSISNRLSEEKLRFQCSVILSFRMNFALVALLNAFGDSRSDNNLEFSHKQLQCSGHCYHRYQRVNGLLKKNISTGRLPISLTAEREKDAMQVGYITSSVMIVIIFIIIIIRAYTQNTYGTNTYRYSFRRYSFRVSSSSSSSSTDK